MHMCYICVPFSTSYVVVGGAKHCYPTGTNESVLVRSFLSYGYFFLFPYPVMLLLPMAVPAAQS